MENIKMTNERKEYLIDKINEIITYIKDVQKELSSDSVIEYNVNENLWCAAHQLQESITYLERK